MTDFFWLKIVQTGFIVIKSFKLLNSNNFIPKEKTIIRILYLILKYLGFILCA